MNFHCVEIDSLLNFDIHVSNICKKAAQQINILARLSKFLNGMTRLLIDKSFPQIFTIFPLVLHFCSKPNTENLTNCDIDH
jgi:hypothetical protein